MPDWTAKKEKDRLLSLARAIQRGSCVALHVVLICFSFQTETELLEDLAKDYSVDDVADFLHRNRMDQYIDGFKEEGIDGLMLVGAADDVLNDLGVSSPLHCFKIQYLFKRLLQKTPTTHALVTVYDFLAANKMDKYGQRFAEEGVDGDMLLEIVHLDPEVYTLILEELGIKKNLDRLKFKQWFKPLEEPKQ